MIGEKKVGKVEKRIEELKGIKKEKDSGKIFCIPFKNYPKLTTSVPGLIPGQMFLCTASSGVGKTQFSKALAVREPLDFAIKNNIDLNIIYFALEESKEEFIDTMICNHMSSKGIQMDLLLLQGFRANSIDQKTMDAIEKEMPYVEKLLSRIDIVDSIYNPYGLYSYCRDVADRQGTHVYEDREFIKKKVDKDPGSDTFGQQVVEKTMTKVYSHYVPNDPNKINIVITDHIGLLQPEKDKDTGKMMSLHETMATWSTKYCLKQISKHWKWCVWDIQQQEQSGEKEQFTNKGESIQKKTEPSLAGLAGNKELQRNYNVIFGVYSPDRYGFPDYHGYDINRFKDKYRAVVTLKNRFGTPNKYHSFIFDGATNRFGELPKANESGAMVPFYSAADVLLGRVGTPKTKNFGK